MVSEIESLVYFRPEQAADIGAVGVLPAFMQLTTNRRPTDIFILLKNQHLDPGFGKERGIDEAIVTCSYDDGIVIVHAGSVQINVKHLMCPVSDSAYDHINLTDGFHDFSRTLPAAWENPAIACLYLGYLTGL